MFSTGIAIPWGKDLTPAPLLKKRRGETFCLARTHALKGVVKNITPPFTVGIRENKREKGFSPNKMEEDAG
jgi:hypothetical protein